MSHGWLPGALLRAASLAAPGEQRAEWLEWWRSELWYVPKCEATRFCLGAFRDAMWLRRNQPQEGNGSANLLESPLHCLAWLAIVATVSSLIAVVVPAPRGGPWPRFLRISDLPGGWMAMLLFTVLMLPAMRLVMGPAPEPAAAPWPRRMVRGMFFALKIALLQPVLLCGLMILLTAGRLVPMVGQLGVFAVWILGFRWALADQRQRCPMCLRLLRNPVRIGNSSRTFLEWHGAESMCARGHGLLQVPESTAGYSGSGRWLGLDDSWRSLFSDARR